MFDINTKILYNKIYTNTILLKKPKLKIKECLINKFLIKKEVIIEIIYRFNEKKLYKINKLKNIKKNILVKKIF